MDEKEAIQTLLQLGQLPTPERIQQLIMASGGKLAGAEPPSVEIPIGVKLNKRKVTESDSSVEVLYHYEYKPKKIEVQDFTNYFRNRYSFMKNILQNRTETEGAISISRLPGTTGKTTLIAIISDIKKLPTGTLKLTIEDLSGQTQAIVSAKNPELAKKIPYLALDEVLAFKGSAGKNIFFVDDLVWPDVPQKTHQMAPDDAYVAFCGDMHSGSNMFLPKDFEKFAKWLRGELGDEKQREIAKKTKYIVVLGDVVDGVGIYPEQEKELSIKDIYKQYDEAAKFLQQIPTDKHILIIPGNHDALRLEESQPILYKHLAAPLYDMPNVVTLSNPAYVKLHKMDDFPGADMLIYHGYSFDYFVDSIEALRLAGGYSASDKLWEFLLKRRHVAPTFGSTLALPMSDDPLLIKQVPDIVASGHIHKAKIGQYKGILTISGSCWQDTTNFQVRVGHNPDPGMVPIVNLKNYKASMLQFK